MPKCFVCRAPATYVCDALYDAPLYLCARELKGHMATHPNNVRKLKAQAAPEPSSAEVPKTFRPDFEIGSKGDLTAEVDGDWKDPEEPYYKKRDAYMESIGIRVMRFSNRSVLHDGKGVIKAIQLELSRVKHL